MFAPRNTNTSQDLEAIVARWPEIDDVHLHLHDARGMALASIYAAMRVLDERFTLTVDCGLGGLGGCPYCGDGRVTRMAPTEDLVQRRAHAGHGHLRPDGAGTRSPSSCGCGSPPSRSSSTITRSASADSLRHTASAREVLCEIGLSDDEYEALARAGVVVTGASAG